MNVELTRGQAIALHSILRAYAAERKLAGHDVLALEANQLAAKFALSLTPLEYNEVYGEDPE